MKLRVEPCERDWENVLLVVERKRMLVVLGRVVEPPNFISMLVCRQVLVADGCYLPGLQTVVVAIDSRTPMVIM
jgi:hypothetical protein